MHKHNTDNIETDLKLIKSNKKIVYTSDCHVYFNAVLDAHQFQYFLRLMKH